MSWNAGGDGGGWQPETTADAGGGWTADNTAGGDGGADVWGGGGGGDGWHGNDSGGGSGGACRTCGQEGHFARDCPDKPAMTGECYNCGEVGHNKADCTNPKVDRPFTGTCNVCQQEGHQARDCPTKPPMECRLCKQEGHRASECKSRRVVDWTGVPEMDAETAWTTLIDAANAKDLDMFRTCLRAYARALNDMFNLAEVEAALRADNIPVYLIGKTTELQPNMTIVDLIGNPEKEFVLSIQLSAKPRRAKFASGWPANPEENQARLANAGFIQDRGVSVCTNCGELGHIKKHCKEEIVAHESKQPAISCVYCSEEGHRARDCPKERVNPYGCRNCKQEGHNSKECPEPRSAASVECHKCNQMGHFSKECPNVEKRTCRNCGSEDHMARDCDQPMNPDNQACRNCEKTGHFSRDCQEPKDWSKVKCRNCGEMGHTIKRCKQPVAEGEDGGVGLGGPVEPVAASGDWGAGDAGGSGW